MQYTIRFVAHFEPDADRERQGMGISRGKRGAVPLVQQAQVGRFVLKDDPGGAAAQRTFPFEPGQPVQVQYVFAQQAAGDGGGDGAVQEVKTRLFAFQTEKRDIAAAAEMADGKTYAGWQVAVSPFDLAAGYQAEARFEGLHLAAVMEEKRRGAALYPEQGIELSGKKQPGIIHPVLPEAGLEAAVYRKFFGRRGHKRADLQTAFLLPVAEKGFADVVYISPESHRRPAGSHRHRSRLRMKPFLHLPPLQAITGRCFGAPNRRDISGVQGVGQGEELGKGGGLGGKEGDAQYEEPEGRED